MAHITRTTHAGLTYETSVYYRVKTTDVQATQVYSVSTFRVQMIGYGWDEEKQVLGIGRACTTATIDNSKSLINPAEQLMWLSY